MANLEVVLATYININLLLAGTALAWYVARRLARHTELARAFGAQLGLLKLIILAAFLFPILLTVYAYQFEGERVIPVTLSELVLSQYLKGNIQVSPSLLEQALTLRQNVMTQLTDPSHPFIVAIVIGGLFTAAFMVVRAVLTGFKLNRILSAAHAWRSFGSLRFVLSDTIRIPFSTRTLFTRYIVLPSTMLGNRTDTKVALAHELQHIRQRDVDWEVAAALLTPVFFWNPAFHFFKRQVDELRELSCDQIVLRRGFLSAKDYCECLLRVCAGRFERPSLFRLRIPEVALVETYMGYFGERPKRLLANRLLSAVDDHTNRLSKLRLAGIACCLIAFSAGLTFVFQKPTDWSHDRLMLSTIINLERLEERNRIGLGNYRSY